MAQSIELRNPANWRTCGLAALLLISLSGCGGGGDGAGVAADSTDGLVQDDLSGGGGGSTTGGTSTTLTAPDPVTGLAASVQDRTIIKIDWSAAPRATRYDLYWSLTPGVNVQSANRIENVTAPFEKGDLDGGLEYHFIMTAANAAGTSTPSSEISITLPPPAVTQLSIVSGDSAIDLAWMPATGATGYRVYWSTSPNNLVGNGQVIAVSAPSFTHQGLQNGTAYHYRVTAIGAGGEGPFSTQLSAQPETPVPTAPRSLSIALHPSDSRSVILAWEAPDQPVRPEDISFFNVYRNNANQSPTLIAQTYSGLFIDSPPVGGVAWSYRVSAVTTAGEGATSSPVSVTTDSSEGDGRSDSSVIPPGVFECGEPTECWTPGQ